MSYESSKKLSEVIFTTHEVASFSLFPPEGNDSVNGGHATAVIYLNT